MCTKFEINGVFLFFFHYTCHILLKCPFQTRKVSGRVFVCCGYRFDLFLRFIDGIWYCSDIVVFFFSCFTIGNVFSIVFANSCTILKYIGRVYIQMSSEKRTMRNLSQFISLSFSHQLIKITSVQI